MNIGPMNERVGMAKSTVKRLSQTDARHFFRGDAIHYQEAVRKYRLARDLIGETKPVEHFEYVGPELNAGSDFLELAGLLDQTRAVSAAAQGERRSEAANSTAYDQDGQCLALRH
jgi:hypothetical protein